MAVVGGSSGCEFFFPVIVHVFIGSPNIYDALATATTLCRIDSYL
jgi:hypothetical protein